jgi:hypothetical protein
MLRRPRGRHADANRQRATTIPSSGRPHSAFDPERAYRVPSCHFVPAVDERRPIEKLIIPVRPFVRPLYNEPLGPADMERCP